MLHNKYEAVLSEFLRGYFGEIYGSGLVGKVGLSQKAIALTLIELEREGILVSKSSGNRKYYSLNFSNPLIEDYIVLFENSRKVLFLKKNKKIIDFSREVGGDVVAVFGSYAKGKNVSGSDLDLLVVGKVDGLGVKKMGRKYGYDVQVFNLSLANFRKGVGSNLVLKKCLGDHVLIKGERLFVKEVLKWEK